MSAVDNVRVRSRTLATSKKKGFVLMTNGFPPLTSFTKIFMLDVSVISRGVS